MIAVEDIGIGDIELVQEVTRIGTDKVFRSVLSSDADLIDDLCWKMASAVKDRSADYLICAAEKLESAAVERAALMRLPTDELMMAAADDTAPLTRRAVAALLACTDRGKKDKLRPDRVEQFLDGLPVKVLPLHDAVLSLAHAQAEPFCIMLPLIRSRWSQEGGILNVAEDELPTPEFYDGIPLYTFDFHTAAGKYAIGKFAHRNSDVRAALAKWVPQDRWTEVVCIVAFYVDAAPVARRLNWAGGSQLAETGFIADMIGAGCKPDGIGAVIDAMRRNLADLNRYRRSTVQPRSRDIEK
ncbi:MAG: hypothetical protein V4499_07385 [Pseudomonadota bacterium]